MSGIFEKALLRIEPAEAPHRPAERDFGQKAPQGKGAAPKIINLDLEGLRSEGYLTPASVSGRLSEQLRRIKRPLLNNLSAAKLPGVERANLIAVTSSLAGEGKTFTAINLAMSMAQERDHTVLLVDADPVQSGTSRRLAVPSGPGLTDVLSNSERSLADVIFHTNVPKLRLIPAGSRNPHSTELLASEMMQRTVKELSERYPDRVILFDVPPLLAASQAQVLCGLVGQIIVVVEQGRTSIAAIQEALGLLDNTKVIGTVLNKTTSVKGYDYYYGEYGNKGVL
jgi:protein-tyrosine kinase